MKKALTKGAKLLAINIAILIGSTIILYLFSIAIGITLSTLFSKIHIPAFMRLMFSSAFVFPLSVF